MQLERFRVYLLFHPWLHLLSFQIFLTCLTRSLVKIMAAMMSTRDMMMIQIFRRH
jgi:hypothetical protein